MYNEGSSIACVPQQAVEACFFIHKWINWCAPIGTLCIHHFILSQCWIWEICTCLAWFADKRELIQYYLIYQFCFTDLLDKLKCYKEHDEKWLIFFCRRQLKFCVVRMCCPDYWVIGESILIKKQRPNWISYFYGLLWYVICLHCCKSESEIMNLITEKIY